MNIVERNEELAKTMARQLRLRGGSLADVAGRAGRKLTRPLAADVQLLVEAETLAAHPKFAHRIDQKQLARAERRLLTFLEKQNPAKERRDAFLDRLAWIVFVLFTILVALFFLLLSRGAFD